MPLVVPIQRASITIELRNGLWSLLHEYYWTPYFPRNTYGNEDPFTKNSANEKLIKELWFSYFKQPIDQIPAQYKHALATLREWFFKGAWYVPYDIVEQAILNGHSGAKAKMVEAVQKLLERENSAYRFVDDQFVEITSAEEIQAIEDSLKVPLDPVRAHISTALNCLSDRVNPDYRNSIKESISAVEAACRQIDGNKNATITSALAKLPQIHPALAKSFSAMYGYTSDADGIRHALLSEPNLSYDDAKYMLVACSAFVNYLLVKVPASP